MPGDTASLVDNIWNEDTTGHYTSPNMAWAASQSGGGSSNWTTAQVDTALNRLLVIKDTTYATLDTLQNAGSDLRGGGTATVDTAAIARSVWDNDVVASEPPRLY
jgi:hypothetical protein